MIKQPKEPIDLNEPIEFTISGGGAKYIIKGNHIVNMKGDFEVALFIAQHWIPTHTSPVPQNVIEALLKANKEILKIRRASKTKSTDKTPVRVKQAKSYLLANKHDFKYIKPEYINDDWFDGDHALRYARSFIFCITAREKKCASNATELLEAWQKTKKTTTTKKKGR